MVDDDDSFISVNLTNHWCPSGISLGDAITRADPEALSALSHEFCDDAKPGEPRAAYLLHLFTCRLPRLHDNQLGRGGGGRADIRLEGSDGREEFAEVMATLDNDYEKSRDFLRRSVAAVSDPVIDGHSRAIELNYGWSSRRLRESGLEFYIAEGHNAPEFASEITLSNVSFGGNPIASVTTDSPSATAPYLTALSDYLSNDPVATKHVAKLRDAGGSRRHLYLIMASTGAHGSLYPTSPGLFTQGVFTPPEQITDFWLDNGFDMLIHWSAEAGWTWHQL